MAFSLHTLHNNQTATYYTPRFQLWAWILTANGLLQRQKSSLLRVVCGCGLTCSRASTKTPPNGFLNHKRYKPLHLKHTGHSNIQFRPPRHAGHSGIWRVGAEQARGVLTGQRAAHLLSCLPEVLWTCAQGNPLRSGPPACSSTTGIRALYACAEKDRNDSK